DLHDVGVVLPTSEDEEASRGRGAPKDAGGRVHTLALGPADPPGDIDHVCAHRRSSLGFHWFCVHCMKKPTHSYSRLARDLLRLATGPPPITRSEEHTSELQSRENLVCRLLLEKKK